LFKFPPQVSSVEFEQFNISAHYCVEAWSSHSHRHAYSAFLLIFTYIAPLVVILASYVLVGRILCTSSARGAGGHIPLTCTRPSCVVARSAAGAVAGEGCNGVAGREGTHRGSVSTRNGKVSKEQQGVRVNSKGRATVRKSSKGGGAGGRGGSTGTREIPCLSREDIDTYRCTTSPPSSMPSSVPGRASSLVVPTGRRTIVRLLVVIVTVFAVCWLPYNVLSLSVDVSLDANHTKLLPFALWLGHAHSAVNPVVYWFFNRTFRHCASNVWLCSLLQRGRRDSRSSQYV